MNASTNAPAAGPEITASGNSAAVVKPQPLLAAAMLCWREIIRFVRQRNRVMGAIGQPLIFWVMFSAGFGNSFSLSAAGKGSGLSFAEFYFPGTIMLILLFTAIFATISIIEDRKEGFLQSVLVSPAPRWSMVLGKVMGGSLLALLQGLIFLPLALTLENVNFTAGGIAALVGLMLVTAIALTSLGFVLAWRMESTQGFHAVMSLLLMPMWLLSGAFFNLPDAAAGPVHFVMHWAMRLNPLTYCVAGARQLMFSADTIAGLSLYKPSLLLCWLIAGGFATVTFAAAWWIAGQRTQGDML